MAAASVNAKIETYLIKKLENAVNQRNIDDAEKTAALLARYKTCCEIKFVSLEKSSRGSLKFRLDVTLECEGNEEKCNLNIPLTTSIIQLKRKIEKKFHYPIEEQSVFFGRKFARDNSSKIYEFNNYTSGVVISITRRRKSFEEPVKNLIEGWTCDSCTYVNHPTRPGCEVCSGNRPENYTIPQKYSEIERKRAENEERELQRYHQEKEKERIQNWNAYRQMDNLALLKNLETFECAICMTEIQPGEGVRIRNCLHNFCFECLSANVRHCEEPQVKCPFQNDQFSCENVLEEREIKKLVDQATYERLLSRGVTLAESQSKDSFHCKTVDCRGWCIYEAGVIIFNCYLCRHDNCIPCQAIHENQTCKEYQDRLQILARTDDEAKKTQEGLEKLLADGLAMKCPKCNVIIIKNGGCDGLTCGNCKVDLCWATKGLRWGPNGRNDTSGGCRCRVNNVPCHPQCQNCH